MAPSSKKPKGGVREAPSGGKQEKITLPGLYERVKHDVIDHPQEAKNQILRLNGSAPLESQREAVALFQASMIEVVAHLNDVKEDNMDDVRKGLAKIPDDPTEIVRLALLNHLKLPESERAALNKVSELMKGSGETSRYFKRRIVWEEIVKEGSGYMERGRVFVAEQIRHHPVRTVLAVAGMAMAASLAYDWLKGGDSTSPKTEGDDWAWGKKALLGLTGVSAISYVWYKMDDILKWFGQKLSEKQLAEIKEVAAGKKEALSKETEKAVKKLGPEGERIMNELAQSRERLEKARKELERAKDDLRKGAEAKEDKEGAIEKGNEGTSFQLFSAFLVSFYFYERKFDNDKLKNNLKNALWKIRDRKVSELAAIHHQYQSGGRLPESALPELSHLSEKQRWEMLDKLLTVIDVVGSEKDDQLKTAIARFAEHPIFESTKDFQRQLLTSAKNVDFKRLFDIDYEQINQKTVKALELGTSKLVDGINRHLSDNLQKELETMSPDERKVFHSCETQVFLSANLHHSPKEVALNALEKAGVKPPMSKKLQPLLETLFLDVRGKTSELLPHIYDRFDFTIINENEVADEQRLRNILTLDGLTFLRASELILAAEGIEWGKEKEKPIHWMKDFAMMQVVLRGIDNPDHRSVYLGHLINVVTTGAADAQLNVPGIANLMDYMQSMEKYCIDNVTDKGIGILETLSATQAMLPKPGSKTYLKGVKEDFLWTSTTQGLGNGLEIIRDLGAGAASAAYLLGLLDVSKKEIENMDDGHDFLRFLFERGGQITYDPDHPGIAMIEIYKQTFFIKPKDTILAALREMAAGDGNTIENVYNGLKIYTASSSLFIVGGAVIGGWRNTGIVKESDKGFIFASKAKEQETIKNFRSYIRAMRKGAWRGFRLNVELPVYWSWRLPQLLGKKVIETTKNIANVPSTAVSVAKETVYLAKAPIRFSTGIANKISRLDAIFKSGTKHGAQAVDLYQSGRMVQVYAAKLADASMLSHVSPRAHNEAMLTRSMEEFSLFYRRYFPDVVFDEKSPVLASQAARRMESFLEMVIQPGKFMSEWVLLEHRHSGGGFSEKISHFLRSHEVPLSDDEIRALTKRMKSPVASRNIRLEFIRAGKAYLKGIERSRMASGALGKLASKLPGRESLRRVTSGAKGLQKRIDKARDAIRKLGHLDSPEKLAEYARLKEVRRKLLAQQKAMLDQTDNLDSLTTRVGSRAKRAGQAISGASTRAKSTIGAGVRYAGEKLGPYAERLKTFPLKGKLAFLGKWGGRFAATGLSAAGLISAIPAGYEALTTNNEDQAKIQGMRSVLGLADAGIGAGATWSSFSAGTAGRMALGRALGYASAALIPLTVAAENVLDVKYDETKTESQWAKHGYHDLLHQWISTYQGVSLGDALVVGGETLGPYALLAGPVGVGAALQTKRMNRKLDKSIDESMVRKYMTAKKMFRVLIVAQENPNALYAAVKEGNKEAIDEVIEDHYTPYHEYFLQKEAPETIHDYHYAQKFLARAQAFNEVMHLRQAMLENGVQSEDEWLNDQGLSEDQLGAFRIAKGPEEKMNLLNQWGLRDSFENSTFILAEGTDFEMDLLDERYDIERGDGFLPSRVLKAYKIEKFASFETSDASRKVMQNLHEIETPYLLYLYAQINQKMTRDDLVLQTSSMMIRDFLMLERHINVDIEAVSHIEHFEPKLSHDELVRHIEGLNDPDLTLYHAFQSGEVPAGQPKGTLAQLASVVGIKLDVREDQHAGVHAMYRLAEYFGYHGPKKEFQLKAFFSEASREHHSVYWNTEEGAWYLYERGMELDDEMGPSLSKTTVDTIIRRMREQPDNVTKHRLDSMFHDAFDYSAQVLTMASILEKGYSQGVQKYGALTSERKAWEVIPWKETMSKSELATRKESLERAINAMKSDQQWKQLDFKIESPNKVTLMRGDSGASINIEYFPNEGSWWIEDFAGGLTFAQAVVMGNLMNYTEGLLNKEGYGAGSDEPFEVDGNEIHFDRAFDPLSPRTATDLTILDKHVPFLDEIGLSKFDISKRLNQWHWNKYLGKGEALAA